MSKSVKLLAFILMAVCIPFAALAQTELVAGKTVTGISGAAGSSKHYVLRGVPAGAILTVSITGSDTDADLYVKYGSAPTRSVYDCRPFKSTSIESCEVGDTREGDYYILIYGYSAYTGLRLVADYADEGEEPPPTGNCTYSATEQEMFRAVNTARAQSRSCGTTSYPAVSALNLSCPLVKAARLHSQDMSSHNNMSHTGSDRSNAGQRITRQGYTWRTWGENIAWGYTSVSAVMTGWLKSPGHCSNIMNGAYRDFGGAMVNNYWTQDFATPR